MSTTTLRVTIPTPVAAPRGARWAAQWAHCTGAAVGRLLHAVGQARAGRELLALARARAHVDPELARQMRLAGEAAEVRALALRLETSDPRHAADLFAAALRHEQGGRAMVRATR